jgi:hypothetical protein
VGCLGLGWGVFTFSGSLKSDVFRETESRLLRFETFSPTVLARTVDGEASQDMSVCDARSQTAMLLMEMPLADAALRSGASNEFDRRIQSLETRSRQLLSCAPRDSFAWLLMFSFAALHGILNDQSFGLLAMSYETSPNEAWVSIRRILIAMPLVLLAPEPLRERIVHEFRQLIRHGFEGEAARSYLSASAAIRVLLQAQVEQLEPAQRKAFSGALARLGP